MPYVTTGLEPKTHQLTIKDIFDGLSESDMYPRKDTKDTVTRYYENIPYRLTKIDCMSIYNSFKFFNEKWSELENGKGDSLYGSFKMSKRSGGYRQIDTPKGTQLEEAQRELKKILEDTFPYRYHTAAFAYVNGRHTKMCVERHQRNKSCWFLKLDFHGFFPSTTPEFVVKSLYNIYPLCLMKAFRVGDSTFDEELRKALSICFLNGGLPQGTVISPMLTNIMMIEFDWLISKYCHNHPEHLVYTRYADDIFISSKYTFDWRDIQKKIVTTLKDIEAPFELNTKKTHYGSKNGANWMLGLMLNKDNNITLGHIKHKELKISLNNFLSDLKKGVAWTLEDVQHLNGVIGHHLNMEPDGTKKILETYGSKFNVDVLKTVRDAIRTA